VKYLSVFKYMLYCKFDETLEVYTCEAVVFLACINYIVISETVLQIKTDAYILKGKDGLFTLH
jgi:hypothetical protein